MTSLQSSARQEPVVVLHEMYTRCGRLVRARHLLERPASDNLLSVLVSHGERHMIVETNDPQSVHIVLSGEVAFITYTAHGRWFERVIGPHSTQEPRDLVFAVGGSDETVLSFRWHRQPAVIVTHDGRSQLACFLPSGQWKRVDLGGVVDWVVPAPRGGSLVMSVLSMQAHQFENVPFARVLWDSRCIATGFLELFARDVWWSPNGAPVIAGRVLDREATDITELRQITIDPMGAMGT